MLIRSSFIRVALPGLTLPSTPDGWAVLALTWGPAVVVGLLLLITLLILLLSRVPPGDNDESQAPAWFRLFVASVCVGLLQVAMSGGVALAQPTAFTQADIAAQIVPRVLVAAVSLVGLLSLFVDYSRNATRALARGRAQLTGPFDTPVIGLLTPTEERISSAYGRLLLYTSAGRRLTGLFVLLIVLPALELGAVYLLSRRGFHVNGWPLLAPVLLCWAVYLLALLRVNAARQRLNRRSLAQYCQELVTLGRKWSAAVDGELRLAGLGMYQRVADLADAIGKERLLHQGAVEASEAVAESRLALAQASLEPGGEGVKMATEYLAGAVELRDLKRGEWLGLGWLLASDYVPESLLRDRARYGHLLLNYCRAWVAAQRQLRQKAPLSAGVKTNVRLRMVVIALEKRICSLTSPDAAHPGQEPPWRSATFLFELAQRPDLQLLLALNEAMLQLDESLPWARLNAGLCRLALGDAQLARAHLEVAASQRRDDPSLAFYRAVAYAREQQSSEALALLEEVTKRDLGWFPAVRMYAETLVEVSKSQVAPPATGVLMQPVSAERWKQALTLIEQALLSPEVQDRLQNPEASPIYVAFGMAELFGKRQPAEADVWFRRALSVDRQDAQAWFGMALASWEQGQIDVALSGGQETLRVQPEYVPAVTLCAQVLMARGEMAPALAMAEQALKLLADPRVSQMRVVHHPRLYPEREVLLRIKGRAAFEQGRFAEAFAALDQVVRRYVDARFFAACALYHLGRYPEVTERLKDYLASKEGAKDYRAFLYLGCALHAQGERYRRAALNALDACLELASYETPERVRALLERGQIYEERGQFEEAQRDYEAALEVERSPVTAYVLAALYHRSGRDQEAYNVLSAVAGSSGNLLAAGQSAALPHQPAAAQGGQGRSGANTLVFMQVNEPIETQIRRLLDILRERLAEGARQHAAALAADDAQPTQPAAEPQAQESVVPEEAAVSENVKPSISVTLPPASQSAGTENARGKRAKRIPQASSSDNIPVQEPPAPPPAEDEDEARTVMPDSSEPQPG
jgi:tetratricopeptide (TPR) repeat protein